MDTTPPPDLPDPASPTPVTSPPAGPAPGASGPKPSGRIRSVPPPVSRASRLPGTYAANFSGDDMNWRRGVGVLWTLFGLTAVLEFIHAGFYLLSGYTGWPLDRDLLRVSLSTLAFLTLWLGWGWTRWVLAIANFLCGLYVLVWGIAGQMGQGSPGARAMVNASPLVGTAPAIGLGLLYLFTAGYVVFSADVIDFARHRKESGRGWIFLPVLLLAGAYVTLLFTLEIPYVIWIKARETQARQFGDATVRRMAEHWDPQSIDGLGDKTFNALWNADFKKGAFASLAPLGPLENPNKVDMYPQATTFDFGSGGFIMQYSYNLRQARFAHGTADIGVFIVKPIFGPWEINDLQMNEVHFDPKPTPAPTPTPEVAPGPTDTVPTPAAASPATPAPTASPGAGG